MLFEGAKTTNHLNYKHFKLFKLFLAVEQQLAVFRQWPVFVIH
jgi:hypothetical protein